MHNAQCTRHKATEKEEAKKAISIQNKTQIDKHCCLNCVWVLGKCEWLNLLFLFSPLFSTWLGSSLPFCFFLYSYPMSVCSECTDILPFIMRTQTSKNVSLLLHGIKKKQKKMYGHFCCCYSQCHFFKICFCINMYKCVQNRFQLFANVFFFLLLFWTLWSCVKRASMTATWMRVFLLIRFRIKIQWTFIHTFLSSSDSVCCFEIKTKFSFVY